MFCRNCGTTNPDTSQYCSKCGNPLSSSAAQMTPPPPPAAGGSFVTPPPFTGDAPTSGKAIASLVFGIFTFIFPASIMAIIFGHMANSEIRKSAGRLRGQGLATTGLVLGYLGILMIPFLLIVAAIAIPNLLRARVAANEASAVGSLRTINTAAMIYATKFENGYPSGLHVMGGSTAGNSNCNRAGLLDISLAAGHKSGYVFTYTPQFPDGAAEPVISPRAGAKGCTAGGVSGYTVTANPMQPGTTGQRCFFTDQTGVIRFSANGVSATADSPPLQ